MSHGQRRTLIPVAYQALDDWPEPDHRYLSELEQAQYFSKRQAVELYAAGLSYVEIRKRTGKCAEEVRRLVKRCVTIDCAGQIFGFTALIHGRRLHGYCRKTKINRQLGHSFGGCAGAMGQLLATYPELRDFIEERLFKQESGDVIHESRISYINLQKAFLRELRRLGVTDSQYPFNTRNFGYNALREWCVSLREQNAARWIDARSGKEAAHRGAVGRGYRPLIAPLRNYTYAQLDYQKVDAASIIVVSSEDGAELEVPVARWYVGYLVEERTSAILGVSLALEMNPTSDSALEAVENALCPSVPQAEDLRYKFIPDKKVVIAELIPALTYQCFSVLKVDNAWCNTAAEVVNNIVDTVGCAVNFGPVRAWWRRALVERVIKGLTERGAQRLPSTYGTGPGDTRVDRPEFAAIKWRIHVSELISIIYRCVRDHNTTSTERRKWVSPMNSIANALSHPKTGFFPQPLPKPTQRDLRLLKTIDEVTVRGNVEKNVRPYFKLNRCRYSNPELADSYRLINQKLLVYTDRRNPNDVRATVRDTGQDLGAMVPEQRWENFSGTLRDWKLILRSGMAGYYSAERGDIMEEWEQEKLLALKDRKRKKKPSPSKDALHVARITLNKKRRRASDDTVSTGGEETSNGVALPIAAPDPFSLLGLPPGRPPLASKS